MDCPECGCNKIISWHDQETEFGQETFIECKCCGFVWEDQ
jgi:DNA-directed RNA polymerase subunit M/transcription elongation factor TFIIS